MKHSARPFGIAPTAGDELVAKVRKQNLKALHHREDEEYKAMEQTRRLRELRRTAETGREDEESIAKTKPARKKRAGA